MSDRGADPEDARAWKPVDTLCTAVHELSWLLGRGYSHKAATKLVGDHHQLTRRQRIGVLRSSCGDADLERRQSRQVEDIDGSPLHIDGFNVLITRD